MQTALYMYSLWILVYTRTKLLHAASIYISVPVRVGWGRGKENHYESVTVMHQKMSHKLDKSIIDKVRKCT